MLGEWAKNNPIFISSTFQDLKEFRATVLDALRKSGLLPECMEVFCATNSTPLDECLLRVRNSKIYVGIFGYRYGTTDPKTKKSYTQLEYEEAEKYNLKKLIFVIEDYREAGIGKFEEKQLTFLEKVKETSDVFSTPDNLTVNVLAALHYTQNDDEQLLCQQISASENKHDSKNKEIEELKDTKNFWIFVAVIAVAICGVLLLYRAKR